MTLCKNSIAKMEQGALCQSKNKLKNKKMKKIILIALTTIGALSSCSKKDKTVAPEQAPQHYENVPLQHKDGGDDDDPIIMGNVVEFDGAPVSNAFYWLTQGADTVSGYTNGNGYAVVQLTGYGTWGLHIEKSNYTPIYTQIDIVQAVTQRVDTVYTE
jgi:hypothetical protein